MQRKDDKHQICFDQIFSQEISIKSVTPLNFNYILLE